MNGELIRFWDEEIETMPPDKLRIEIKVQKGVRTALKNGLQKVRKREEASQKTRYGRFEKIEFFEAYIKELDGLIATLEHRYEQTIDNTVSLKRAGTRYQYRKTLERIGDGMSWDKDKFMLVAKDRGYLSEQSVIAAVANELGINIEKAKMLLNSGRFTWGQVMCMGALLQMNPKEFTDIFMHGYFVEHYGEYIASYENISKDALLKRIMAL